MKVRPLVPALAIFAAMAGTPARAPAVTAPFMVGTARASIAPEFPYPGGDIYLGGVFPGPLRKADGNAATTWARAIAFSTSAPGSGLIIGEIDTQGAFAAYRQGTYGLADVQVEVAAATGLDPRQIILAANHSHAGADGIGVWGGVPESYLRFVSQQLSAAARAAWSARRPATLAWATTRAPDLLANQSRVQSDLDDELRVLVASDPSTKVPFAFMTNWQGHPSIVPGTKVHPDWPGMLNEILEARHPGAFSITIPGDIGRTQTGRQGSTDADEGAREASEYAATLADRAEGALITPHAVAAGPVAASQVFFTEDVTNPLIIGLFYGGRDGVADVYRSKSAPWFSSPRTIGSRTFTARIGSVLIGAAPGEAYPIIRTQLHEAAGAAVTFFVGLAGDQLGYLISPQQDVPLIATDGNDNVAFMLSPSIGDHVMCSLLKGAGAIGFSLTWTPSLCATWAGEQPDGGLS